MRNIETLLKLKEYRVLSYSQVPKTFIRWTFRRWF